MKVGFIDLETQDWPSQRTSLKREMSLQFTMSVQDGACKTIGCKVYK